MSNNENLPRLFDDAGHLIEVAPDAMDPATRERHAAVVAAYQANQEAQTELEAAHDGVTAALAEVDSAQTFHDAHWPRQSFHDLWRDTFGNGPHNAKLMRGIR